MEDTHADVWFIDIKNITKLQSRQLPQCEDIWQLLPTIGEAPGKITNHKAVAIGNIVYVYGGLINNDKLAQSLFSLNVESGEWKKVVGQVLNCA